MRRPLGEGAAGVGGTRRGAHFAWAATVRGTRGRRRWGAEARDGGVRPRRGCSRPAERVAPQGWRRADEMGGVTGQWGEGAPRFVIRRGRGRRKLARCSVRSGQGRIAVMGRLQSKSVVTAGPITAGQPGLTGLAVKRPQTPWHQVASPRLCLWDHAWPRVTHWVALFPALPLLRTSVHRMQVVSLGHIAIGDHKGRMDVWVERMTDRVSNTSLLWGVWRRIPDLGPMGSRVAC